jgi:hypothetical protein
MYSYDRRMAAAGVVTAAMDLDLAKAYADAWSDGLIGKYAPKYIKPAKLGEMLRDHWMNEVGMSIRNLQFRSSKWMAPGEWATQMKLLCPEYNGFHAGKVGAWLGRYPGVEVQPAREYSVCLYLKGDPDSLSKISSEASRVGRADESDFQGDGTLRLWWD